MILCSFMNTQKFKILFSKYETIDKTQIDHIWTNAPRQQCHSRLKLIDQTINLFTSYLNYQTMCLVSLHQQIKHTFTYN
jgi:hypothetical protein